MKTLKAEKEKLTALKNTQYEAYQNLRGYQNELKTVCTNVDMILGKIMLNIPNRKRTRIYLSMNPHPIAGECENILWPLFTPK